MRLERHEMAGFCHLSGPFVLNLRDLPHGLIAVRGPNGAGKTSHALDGPLAGLYGPGAANRAFASREGTLATYATSREAYIDDVWTLEGVGTFRVRVNVDGKRRTTDAVLLEVTADGRQVPLNNGQSGTFRKAVAELFPSQRSLLASAFAGQSRRGSFGELGQKERMELFVELADLAHLESKALRAAALATTCLTAAGRIRAAADVLDVGADAVAQARQRLADLDVSLAGCRADADAARLRITAAVAECARWQEGSRRHAAAREKADAQLRAIAALEVQLAAVNAEDPAAASAAAVRQAGARLASALTALARRRSEVEASHQSHQRDRAERIGNNERLLKDADRYRTAARQRDEARSRAEAARNREREHREQATEAGRMLVVARRELDAIVAAARQLQDAQRRAGLLSSVKFGEPCATDPACPLVTDAVAARAQAVALEPSVRAQPEAAEAVAGWEITAGEHTAAAAAASLHAREEDQEAKRLAKDADMVPHLDAAQSRIDEYRADELQAARKRQTDLAGLADDELAARRAHAADVAAAEQDAALLMIAKTVRMDALSAQVTSAKAEHSVLAATVEETAGAEDALRRAERSRDVAESECQRSLAAAARVEAERDAAILTAAELETRAHRAAAARLRLREAEDEGLAWQTLARALGRDGVQRLEIDAAGPVVSDLANRLLEVGYGPRFSVNVVTQVATADGKDVKEKFTIEVTDNDHGGEARDIGDLSGGERVVVDEALRAALACYVNTRSRQRCRTIWRDETTGSLFPENVAPYVAMLRKLRELSGADHVIFITHVDLAAEMADVVVDVRDGCATVRTAA